MKAPYSANLAADGAEPPRLMPATRRLAGSLARRLALIGLITSLCACAVDSPVKDRPPTSAPHLKTPTTSAVFDAFACTAAGQAGTEGPQVSAAQGLGTWRLGGQSAALALLYGVHFGGFDVAGGFALESQRLTAVWLYCRDGSLTHIAQIDTAGGPLQMAEATGTCQVSYLPVRRTLQLPALDLALPKGAAGFRVAGPEIHLGPALADGTSGTLRWGGQPLPAWVFARVPCGECAKVGWEELHLLAYRADPPQIITAIAYLYADAPGQVQLGRAVQWPEVALAPPQTLQATWALDP